MDPLVARADPAVVEEVLDLVLAHDAAEPVPLRDLLVLPRGHQRLVDLDLVLLAVQHRERLQPAHVHLVVAVLLPQLRMHRGQLQTLHHRTLRVAEPQRDLDRSLAALAPSSRTPRSRPPCSAPAAPGSRPGSARPCPPATGRASPGRTTSRPRASGHRRPDAAPPRAGGRRRRPGTCRRRSPSPPGRRRCRGSDRAKPVTRQARRASPAGPPSGTSAHSAGGGQAAQPAAR